LACKALWDCLVIKGYTNKIVLNWIEILSDDIGPNGVVDIIHIILILIMICHIWSMFFGRELCSDPWVSGGAADGTAAALAARRHQGADLSTDDAVMTSAPSTPGCLGYAVVTRAACMPRVTLTCEYCLILFLHPFRSLPSPLALW